MDLDQATLGAIEDSGAAGPTGLDRRRFLRTSLVAGAVLGGLAGAGAGPLGAITRAGASPTNVDPHLFTLGVASGDPGPDRVTIWTRLAPDPLNGGGLAPADLGVRYEVAEDEAFARIVARGRTLARAQNAHTVHVRVTGLAPNRWYWYRFIRGGEASPVGRTRTFPLPQDSVSQLVFAFSSCQSYPDGYYTAHRALADEGVDAMLWLGDYIYEGGAGGGGVRQHNSPEVTDLPAYRNRHALYRLDPDLQAAHASAPWIMTWDDHEAENNYAGLVPQDAADLASFPARRIAAYKAWWEHIPVRGPAPTGQDYTIHRRMRFGRLANFHVLDGRQYRSDQACADPSLGLGDVGPMCEAGLDPQRSMLGGAQEQWLADGLVRSGTTWNVLANQVVFAPLHLPLDLLNIDQWDGYPAARKRLLYTMLASRARNPVVITGDIHNAGAADIHAVPDDPDAPVIASEYVGPSITSGRPAGFSAIIKGAIDSDPRNAHIRYFDEFGRHGYVRCTVTPESMRADYRYISTTAEQTATISTGASFVTEAGNPGVTTA